MAMITIKSKLAMGKAVIGTFVNVATPGIVEILGLAGFDFIVIDMEHSSLSYQETESLIRTADLVGLAVIVRTGGSDRVPILKAMDFGAEGVLVPMINSHQLASEAVQHAHYPPKGDRGLSSTNRAVRYGFGNLEKYINDSYEKTLVAVQIETEDAVDNVEKIASLDGVDILFIGPSDLSMSLQTMGNRKHEKMKNAYQRVVSAAMHQSKAIGTFVNTAEQLEDALTQGAQFIIWGTSMGFVASSAKEIISMWKQTQQ